MNEYEYEVTFYGEQWRATILVYHEEDSELGGRNARSSITLWALGVADQLGLGIGDFNEVKVEKTGVLGRV